MVDTNSLTPVVKELYECICQLSSQGKDFSLKSLKAQMPNHSYRDYTAALDVFKDEQAFIKKQSLPMPQELKTKVESMLALQWATLCKHFNEMKVELENQFNERLREARSVRDEAIDRNAALSAENLNLSKQLEEAQKTINELRAADEKYKKEITAKDLDIAKLKVSVEAKDESIKELRRAFESISKKGAN